MTRAEATLEYTRALKKGQRNYRESTAAGRYPYLPTLDSIIPRAGVDRQVALGTFEIPLELVIGTKTEGRTKAFSSNFMPLLDARTEFAAKWTTLCLAHVDEGIRDPIRCYEYMGKFYAQEGNKRVSVLKFFEADSVLATVTRVMPFYRDTPEIRHYYEFVDSFPLSRMYVLRFTQDGSFAKLQTLMGKKPDEKWTEDDRADIISLYNWVKKAYYARGGEAMHTTVADVLLLLVRLYTLEALKKATPSEISANLNSVWDNVLAIENPESATVSTQPAAPQQAGLLERILPGVIHQPKTLKVAFVNERTPEASTWTSSHEFGRTQLDQVFEGQVNTVAYNGAVPGQNDEDLIEQAITEGADVVFTTSPQLVEASLHAALRHPAVDILNCSMDIPYASIRTYYTRVYEAKFITGAIAGAMARQDTIGYVADYPIFGVPANINAFALGARMTNPRAKIKLRWSCLPGQIMQDYAAEGVTVISGRDTPDPTRPQREFGTFEVQPGGRLQDLASPFWHWGQFYENVVRSMLDGGWNRDKSGNDGRTISYWWGMNSGVMDVLFSRELPHDVRHLAEILRSGVKNGSVDPFACHIVGQDGALKNEGRHGFTPEQILHMDWLCDAVEGSIPQYDELSEISRPMYRMQGIHRDELPAEKEALL